jgi:outer membrane phospholipase A
MRIRPLIVVLPLLLASGAARAEWLLASSVTRVAAGEPVGVSVVRDTAAGEAPLPQRLGAILEVGERLVSVELVAAEALPADAMRGEYVLQWPADVGGTVVLRLAQRASSRLLLAAEAAPPPPGEDAVAAPAESEPAASPVRAPPALTLNEPMYFLVGTNGNPSARLQLSFKYRMFDVESGVVEWLPVLRGLHFGYTQTSLWDLKAESKPFRDTSFRPSLFYLWDIPTAPDSRHLLGVRAGYEHESNGRDGENSRSIDTLFTSLDWRYRIDDGRAYIGFTPKVWGYIDSAENSDIHRFRGYGELGVRFGSDDGWLARVNLRRAVGGVGSTQVDLSYPLTRAILSDTAAYLHLQAFDGFGETLLDYNQSHGTKFRIGFSIQR